MSLDEKEIIKGCRIIPLLNIRLTSMLNPNVPIVHTNTAAFPVSMTQCYICDLNLNERISILPDQLINMDRREALKRTAAITGLAVTSSAGLGLLSGCEPTRELDWQPKFLTDKEVK